MTRSRRTTPFFVGVVLAPLLASGCSDFQFSTSDAFRDGTTAIRTDGEQYQARLGTIESGGAVDHWVLELEIGFTFTNRSLHPVYIPGCRGVAEPRIEKRVSEGWITVYDPPRLMCMGTPLEVKSGARHTHAMAVRGHDPRSSHHPRWESAPIHGEYRLVWDVRSGPGADAAPIPLELRLSNTFRIEAPGVG